MGALERAPGRMSLSSLHRLLSRFADPRPEESPSLPEITGRSAVAVVIDDDPGMRSLMTLSLQQCGYTVVDVADGYAAIAAAQELPRIDLVIADLEVRGMRAPAVVHSLRAMNGYMPVVYVSEDSSGMVGVSDPVLKKPFTCAEWLGAVAETVGVMPGEKIAVA